MDGDTKNDNFFFHIILIWQPQVFRKDNMAKKIGTIGAWSMVKKASQLVDIELRAHDLSLHVSAYASRSSNTIKTVITVIFRQAYLPTTH